MGLFTPAWKSDNEEKALAFIEKCDNQEKLKIIALEKIKETRRIAAIKKLTDQVTLAEIVQKEGFLETGKAALEKMTDQTVLKEIAQNKTINWRIVVLVLERLLAIDSSCISDEELAEISLYWCTQRENNVSNGVLNLIRDPSVKVGLRAKKANYDRVQEPYDLWKKGWGFGWMKNGDWHSLNQLLEMKEIPEDLCRTMCDAAISHSKSDELPNVLRFISSMERIGYPWEKHVGQGTVEDLINGLPKQGEALIPVIKKIYQNREDLRGNIQKLRNKTWGTMHGDAFCSDGHVDRSSMTYYIAITEGSEFNIEIIGLC